MTTPADPDKGLRLKPSVVRRLKKSSAAAQDELLTREQMEKRLNHYDLSTLTVAVGPTGDLRPEKPCPGAPITVVTETAHGVWCCGGTGKVHNPADPIFQALWEKCHWCHGDGKERVIKPGGFAIAGAYYEVEPSNLPCSHCTTGYIPRPRAEAALALLEAAHPIALRYDWSFGPTPDGWEIWNPMGDLAKRSTLPDAVAAAIESKLRGEVT